MKAAIYAYTARGCRLARKLRELLLKAEYETVEIKTTASFAAAFGFAKLSEPARVGHAEDFSSCDALLFVGACGIALRSVAPCIKSKEKDPAVLVIDEQANFVIPVLSGHIGGANALARYLAPCLGAVACVTTATDVNGLFAVDEWAARNAMVIDSLPAAKKVAAALVAGEEVGLSADFPVSGPLPKYIKIKDEGAVGFRVALNTEKSPYSETLHLLPKIVRLGIGCRRGARAEQIEETVERVLAEAKIDLRTVKSIASIDVKKDEAGLLAFAEKMSLPLHFYSKEELQAAAGDFSASAFVSAAVGVDNVCERAAVRDGGERILVPKTSLAGLGATVAAAAENLLLDFTLKR